MDADLGDPACETAAGECTVRAAFMQANVFTDPSTINIPAGDYTISIPDGAETNFADRGDFDVVTDIVVVGAGSAAPASGPGGTIIDAAGLDRVFQVGVGHSLSLTGMTLRNGAGAVSGGAILAGFGDPAGATLTLDDVAVEDSTSADGGGVTVNGTLQATNSTFQNNETTGEGGGVFYIAGPGHMLQMDDVQLLDNTAGLYGGLAINGPATLDGIAVRGNEAIGAGGGIGAFGDVEIADSTIQDNHVTTAGEFTGHGGGIYTVNSTLTIAGTEIAGNSAAGRGGGIMVIEQIDDTALVSIDGTTIEGNMAKLGGGGLRMGNGANGGGHMTVTNSTFSNNTSGSGGAIYNFGPDTSVLNMFNVTLSGNSADDSGGAIRTIGAEAETLLSHATITDNRADANDDLEGDGGGINQDDGAQVTLRNSILYGNSIDSTPDHGNCSGVVEGQGKNLAGDLTGCSLSGEQVTGDPLLGPLAGNDGATQTHALGEGSAAKDVVDTCPPPATDQRGVTRPQGDACDLGSFEAGPPATPTPSPSATPPPGDTRIWGDVDCDGEITTRDNQAELRFVLQQNPLSQTEPCPDIGETVNFVGTDRQWGDDDCDGEITTRDNQAKLRFVLQQNPLSQTQPCPAIGDTRPLLPA